MKKTDLYLKPGTYIKSNSAVGHIQGISLENFVVSVLNNPTCCAKPVFIKNGMLMTTNYLSGSLQSVLDQGSNTSPLQLSTQLVRIESNLEVAERLKIESDSTVTTQTSSVIQATTTNASLVLAPNGTGALVSAIPDGTATGGNARGTNAIDFQMARTNANQVAAGAYSFIGGGSNNRISNSSSVVVGGNNNFTSNSSTFMGGGDGNLSGGIISVCVGGSSNSASAGWSFVGGGQSNTASTGTHATVVGGQSNTASGSQSISGGLSCIASGSNSLALGYKATSSATGSISIASNDGSGTPQASGSWSNIFGGVSSTATNNYSTALGGFKNIASGFGSYALGYRSEAYLRGQMTLSGNFITSNSDVQQSLLTPYKEATLTTAATTVLSLDGTGTTNLIIPNGNNRAWNVTSSWVAVVTAITGTATGISVGDVVTSIDLLAFKRVGGTSTASAHTSVATKLMVTTPAAYAACAIAYTAGASQEMALTFTGPTFVGGGSVTMRVVARIELSEVAW